MDLYRRPSFTRGRVRLDFYVRYDGMGKIQTPVLLQRGDIRNDHIFFFARCFFSFTLIVVHVLSFFRVVHVSSVGWYWHMHMQVIRRGEGESGP